MNFEKFADEYQGKFQKLEPGPRASWDEWLAKSGKWFIYANTTTSQWGDVSHCGSWQGYRKLNSELYYRIRIYGRKRSGCWSWVPYRWSAELCLAGTRYRIKSTHPSCKSISDACHQADRALTPDAYRMACEHFYSHSLVVCVARELTAPQHHPWAHMMSQDALVGQMIPWLSEFGGQFRIMDHYGWGSRMRVPSGTYATAYRDHRDGGQIRGSKYNVDAYGYTGGGAPAAYRFAHWLPELEPYAPRHREEEAASPPPT